VAAFQRRVRQALSWFDSLIPSLADALRWINVIQSFMETVTNAWRLRPS
jgi:hypothetical protein